VIAIVPVNVEPDPDVGTVHSLFANL